jgi:hypothetical protein
MGESVEILADMDCDGFCALVAEIKTLGYDEETACHFAALIGDTPMMEANMPA